MVLLAISEIFLHENKYKYISYRFNYKFAFILVLSFLTNQIQEPSFQQVGILLTRNIVVFVYSESRSTSKTCRIQQIFIKEFSYIPVRIIVPCLHKAFFKKQKQVCNQSACVIFCMIFDKRCFSQFMLLSDQTSLPDYLYFSKYWTMFAVGLFFVQPVMP